MAESTRVGSGSASASIRSARPASATASISSPAIARTVPSCVRTAPGVSAFCASLRIRVCAGGSWLISAGISIA